jgi:hypothetical protein
MKISFLLQKWCATAIISATLFVVHSIAAHSQSNPDGSMLIAGSGGNLVTSAGTWTFSSVEGAGGYDILVNGESAGGGSADALYLENGGQVYALNSLNVWYLWGGSSWSWSASPLSPDGSVINAASGGSLITKYGNWTFSSSSGAGGYDILLQGNSAGGGSANSLYVENGGQVYALNSSNNWYLWSSGWWTPVNDPLGSNTGSGSSGSSGSGSGSTGSGSTGSGTGSTTDQTVGVLPSYNDASANWAKAGLLSVGGIPNRTTVCATVNPSGVTPPASSDDANNISNAIASCPSGEVVMLAAGTFEISMSEYISLGNSVTLRGSGTCNNAASPYCQSVIEVYDGTLAWTGGNCGTSTSAQEACVENPAIQVIPSAASNYYDFGWSACGHSNVASTSCGAVALTTDAAQGQTTIQVSNTSSFAVGMWVLIDEASGAGWQNDPVGPNLYGQVWASSDWLSTSGSPATGRVQWAKFSANPADMGDFDSGQYPYTAGSPGCWYSSCDRVTEEIHLVTAVGSNTITFDDPLTVAFRESGNHNAYVYFPAHQNGAPMAFLQYAGVENLTIERPTNGGVNFIFCAYCWTKNVEVVGWQGGGVNFDYSVRGQMDTTFVNSCGNSVNNGAEYPIGISSGATEIYVVNSITRICGKGMVGRTGAGSVVAYSYFDDTMYDSYSGIGDYWVDMGLNGSHYAATHHWLFEGNWADNLDNDDTHGNAVYHTYFRNWSTALRTPFTDPSLNKTVNDATGVAYACGTTGPSGCSANTPGPLRAAGPMEHDYWFAFVGNVLGTSGVTVAPNWIYSGNYNDNQTIWLPGWNSDANNPTKSDPNLTATSGAFIFKHGDYDYVNGGIVDWTSGYSQTLPNSFYLSGEPGFFSGGASCTYSWPWVTPTGSSQIQTNSCGGSGLPAKARFDAGTPFTQP